MGLYISRKKHPEKPDALWLPFSFWPPIAPEGMGTLMTACEGFGTPFKYVNLPDAILHSLAKQKYIKYCEGCEDSIYHPRGNNNYEEILDMVGALDLDTSSSGASSLEVSG